MEVELKSRLFRLRGISNYSGLTKLSHLPRSYSIEAHTTAHLLVMPTGLPVVQHPIFLQTPLL